MHKMIEWFTRNDVAANLLMVFIVIMGLLALTRKIPLEVFPEIELDVITIGVPYRGATPGEVEEAVIIRIEEAIQDLQGIKEIVSIASEGGASLRIEVEKGSDTRELLEDLKNRVDGITTFPDETETPTISQLKPSANLISLVVAGDLPEKKLRRLGEDVRNEILSLPGVTQANLQAVRPYEIAIEISEVTLQQYGLTFNQIAQAIRRSSLDVPAGNLKTEGGEILLRTKGQAYTREDYATIPIITHEDGLRLNLGEIANIRDGFEETPLYARFNGKPAVLIDVYRVGNQNAITLSKTVKEYIEQKNLTLPSGVKLFFWLDASRIVQARLNTLLNSAFWGGLLVFLVLALTMRFSLALWVCLGIPVSFLGAIALMPHLGITINIVSLFGFILVMGVVVDDAIVVGENIFTHLDRKKDGLKAAIEGSKEVAIPVVFGVLTTVAAFTPLLMVEGDLGKLFMQIPAIIIPVLLFSLIESKLILPAHLKHLHASPTTPPTGKFAQIKNIFADGIIRFNERIYQPTLAWALKNKYTTLGLFLAFLILLVSMVLSGRIRYTFFPRVQSERAMGQLVMPAGTPSQITEKHIHTMYEKAVELKDAHRDPHTGESVVENILSIIGAPAFGRRNSRPSSGQSHLGGVVFEITPPEERTLDISSSDLIKEWRKAIGPIPGAKEQNFKAEIGHGGNPIDIQLSGQNFSTLKNLADQIKHRLQEYPDVFDITDSFEDGKLEVKLKIKPDAEQLGLSEADLARQVRQAFFGEEAQRIQRGRDDVRVMVRYPESKRQSLTHLENMQIRTPDGTEVPFYTVADIELGKGFTSIRRVNRNRTINVTADINKVTGNQEAIKQDLYPFITELMTNHPKVIYSLEGETRNQAESFGSLKIGLIFILFTIYTLLAIPFRSYLQPLIVMSVIPFGVVGAILGHIIMGMSMSIMSIFGLVALTGVVVNDSLVLVDFINQRKKEGVATVQAVHTAGAARLRAILLTSITTFAGLMPLIFEKSTQAQFLIPMAVSLGFGILFATFITLLLVPINYLILEDFLKIFRIFRHWFMNLITVRPSP